MRRAVCQEPPDVLNGHTETFVVSFGMDSVHECEQHVTFPGSSGYRVREKGALGRPLLYIYEGLPSYMHTTASFSNQLT